MEVPETSKTGAENHWFFRKGQLVAVRQFEKDPWVPAVFQSMVGEDPADCRYKARRLGYASFGVRWRYCLPAQEVWPWMEKLQARIVCEDKHPQFDVIDKATCLISSLKSLIFSIGGTHVAGWVEEAERAARQGRVVKYE